MQLEYTDILNFISEYIPLNNSDIEYITEYFEPMIVSKNTLLETENSLTNYLYFINNGFVRIFYNKDGEERTTQINCPSRFITSYQSFITKTKAYDNVQTISDCNLLRITKKDLDFLNEKIANWAIFGEKIYELALIYNEQRTRDMILLTAEDRYIKLVKNYADIIKNVPLQYIASYIGIKPESLSRIRRNLNY